MPSDATVGEWERFGRWILAFLLLDLTETVSVVEVLGALAALVVVLRYSQRAVVSFREQRRYQRENQPLTLRLRTQIRSERFLALLIAAELLFGQWTNAMLQPPTEAAEQWNPIALASAGFLLGLTFVLLLKGELVERHEHALGWLYEQQVRLYERSHELDDDVHGHMVQWVDP